MLEKNKVYSTINPTARVPNMKLRASKIAGIPPPSKYKLMDPAIKRRLKIIA